LLIAVVATAWKIRDARAKIAQKHQALGSAKEVLVAKQGILDQSREQRQTAAIEWNSINKVELKQWMENAKMMQEQEKFQLDECRKFKAQTEEAIAELNEEHIQILSLLKTLQDDVAEGTAENDIIEQRLNNEMQIAEQVLQKKFERHWQRIESANMNIAKELRDTLVETSRRQQLVEDMDREIEANIKKIQSLTVEKEEKLGTKELIAVQIVKVEDRYRELQEKKNSLMKSIAGLKQEKQDHLDDFEKRSKTYNAKIEKEQRRQMIVGVIDDGDSSTMETHNASIDEIKSITSEMSSSLSGSDVKAEKIIFEGSMICDSSDDSSSTKKRQKK
jgi:chromosome segregation ATPase